MTDLNDTLTQIKARAEEATEGPWEVYDANEGMFPPRPLWSVDNEANRSHEDYGDEDYWPAIDLHLETGAKEDAEFIAAARDNVPRLVEALEAVLELHRPEPFEDEPTAFFCVECQRAQLNGTYPCPTVRALTDKLTGEDDVER